MYPQALLGQLGKLTEQQQKLQNQVSTGLRLNEASDDPGAARKVMLWQAEKSALNQYRNNIETQQDIATSNTGLLQSLKTLSNRANEIAVQADGTWSAESLNVYATELDGLIEQAVSLGNTRFSGKYLLSGTASDTLPFEVTRDASDRITGVSFNGNASTSSIEVAPGTTLSAQWVGGNDGTGSETGLLQDAGQDVDLFRDLISLRDHLLTADVQAIQETDIQRLQADEDHLIHFMGISGTMQARMETYLATLNDQEFAISGMISKEGDADIAATIVRLNEVQYAYQAALQSGAKIMNRSLMDFLR
jgi:flagellar hook-associated protein 3 FlgL